LKKWILSIPLDIFLVLIKSRLFQYGKDFFNKDQVFHSHFSRGLPKAKSKDIMKQSARNGVEFPAGIIRE